MTTSEVRSTFVDVLAWIFIILSGFGTFVIAIELIFFKLLFNSEQMQQTFATAAHSPNSLDPSLFMNIFYGVFVFFLLLTVAMLASSIGLLRRKNWARIVFITMLVIGIVWNLLGALGQGLFALLMHAGISDMPAETSQMASTFSIVFIVGVVFGLAFCVLFGWIIKRLRSPAIVAEFKPAISASDYL